MGLLDSEKIELPCDCGHKLSETIGRLKNKPKLICPKCKTVITVKMDKFNSAVSALDKQLQGLGFK